MHGDRIVVTRSQHQVRFLHPRGWTYFDTLREKLHWNEGVAVTVSLKRIVLRDFVIVSELELDLRQGFTVLTGETGAGKSILIDALQLVTGARADTGVIREGASRTEVSAEFDAAPPCRAGWKKPGLSPATPCCCAARSTPRARAAPGSTAARPPPPSCANWASSCSTSMASTPGKA